MGHMKVLVVLLWLLEDADILLMAVEEKCAWRKVWLMPTSEHMVQTLSLYLFSLNSSASWALPSAEILLGFTSTLPWLCLTEVLTGLLELWCVVELGRDVPSLARLAAGPDSILME